MSYKIANIKISIKTKGLCLNNVLNKALENKLYCVNYKNYIVLKNTFTYIIFKYNKNKINHINITKLKSKIDVLAAIKLIKKLLNIKIHFFSIDNIIATGFIGDKLNLQFIIEKKYFEVMKYNNETFPGLFIKFEIGTIILFSTGKFVCVGVKSEKNLKCLIQKIHVLI